MFEALKMILEIQELDMQLIQLVRLKRSHQGELNKIRAAKDSVQHQLETKDKEILELKKDARVLEGEIASNEEAFKKLEAQQAAIKKVEEFNALNQEMSRTERDRIAKEQKLSDLLERLAAEAENLKKLQQHLADETVNSKALEEEICEAIVRVNEEGKALQVKRDALAKKADSDVLHIYERLLQNKRDRVVVPIEDRCCSGCHITVTAQDENLVRKGERLVFCEHCSRIHYWQESEALEGTTVAPTRQRRRRSTAASAT